MCVIAGLTPHNELDGVLVLGQPGFVQVLDECTCLLQLESQGRASSILRRLHHALSTGQLAWLGLFFICHPTRERLCVQGTVETLSSASSAMAVISSSTSPWGGRPAAQTRKGRVRRDPGEARGGGRGCCSARRREGESWF